MDLNEWKRRYDGAVHAQQSAVAAMMAAELGSVEGPEIIRVLKHLRVGVNNAMADIGALYGLLVEKGVLTDEEARRAILAAAEREAKSNADMAIRHLALPPGTTFA